MIKSVYDLEVYQLSYSFAMEVIIATRNFPRAELYSLTDQLVRSSRSITANIAEGWGKRIYENEFKKHLVYGFGSLEETKVWISFAKDCNHISVNIYNDLFKKSDELGAKLFKLHQNWKSLS